MLIVISPAKTLDFASPLPTRKFTQPAFQKEAQELNAVLRNYSANRLSKLMSISKSLGELNAERNLQWSPPFSLANARQAIFAFKGDVYNGLDINSFNANDLQYAQQHLRILSGLYGLLKPLDLMQAYRLEMGTSLKNAKGKNLYEFWGSTISQALNKALKAQKDKVLINLASQEYFSAVDLAALDADVITPVFKDYSKDQYKVISFFAKKARGMMAAWVLKNRIGTVEDLCGFAEAGYRFNKSMSNNNELVFIRKQA